MSDHEQAWVGDEGTGTQERDPDVVDTGDPAVDEVVAAVQALDSRPVEEHVAVYEQAHDRLRRALDDGGHGTGGNDAGDD